MLRQFLLTWNNSEILKDLFLQLKKINTFKKCESENVGEEETWRQRNGKLGKVVQNMKEMSVPVTLTNEMQVGGNGAKVH